MWAGRSGYEATIFNKQGEVIVWLTNCKSVGFLLGSSSWQFCCLPSKTWLPGWSPEMVWSSLGFLCDDDDDRRIPCGDTEDCLSWLADSWLEIEAPLFLFPLSFFLSASFRSFSLFSASFRSFSLFSASLTWLLELLLSGMMFNHSDNLLEIFTLSVDVEIRYVRLQIKSLPPAHLPLLVSRLLSML